MRDASLDEFLAGSDEEPEGEADLAGEEQSGSEPEPGTEVEAESGEPDPGTGSDGDAGASPGTEAEGSPSVEDVDPARSTFAWSPDGGACAGCGERVEERWESDVGLVCSECKEW